MIRMLVSAALHLAANAIGLLIADLVLADLSIDASAFIFAVLIFTVVEVIAEPLIQKVAIKNAHALVGSVALITTLVGLVVTDIISDGLDIDGLWTWVVATLIVWLCAMLAGFILSAIFVKDKVEARQAA